MTTTKIGAEQLDERTLPYSLNVDEIKTTNAVPTSPISNHIHNNRQNEDDRKVVLGVDDDVGVTSSSSSSSLDVETSISTITTTTTARKQLPPPVVLLEQYMEQHSHESLQSLHKSILIHNNNNNNNNNINATQPTTKILLFAVGYYSCPHQGGNRIHHFMNSMIWSIVLNVTFLWNYYDYNVCTTIGKGHDSKICHVTKTWKECFSSNTIRMIQHESQQQQQKQQRKSSSLSTSVVPSYKDWSNFYNLPMIHRTMIPCRTQQQQKQNKKQQKGSSLPCDTNGIYRLNYWTTHSKPKNTTLYNQQKPKYPWHSQYETIHKGGIDIQLQRLIASRSTIERNVVSTSTGTKSSSNKNHLIKRSLYETTTTTIGSTSTMNDFTTAIVIDFPQMLGQDAGKELLHNMDFLLHTSEAKERSKQLLSLGVPFLYGMIFRHVFQFHPSILPTTSIVPTDSSNSVGANNIQSRHLEEIEHDKDDNIRTKKTTFSIAIHSRHSKPEVKGSNIKKEIECLTKILSGYYNQRRRRRRLQEKEKKSRTSSVNKFNKDDYHSNKNVDHDNHDDDCNIFIMSDRPVTVTLLGTYVKDTLNCTPHFVQHDQTTKSSSFRAEHGPFSGTGFYRDLAFATHDPKQKKNFIGFIGSKGRSSSLLFLELIEYDRKRILYDANTVSTTGTTATSSTNVSRTSTRRRSSTTVSNPNTITNYHSRDTNQIDMIDDIPICWLPTVAVP